MRVEPPYLSMNISGEWDCQNFGKLTLHQNNETVNGAYTFRGGSVNGSLQSSLFAGHWKQLENNTSGRFEFIVHNKDGRPSFLKGKWNEDRDADWRKDSWNCTKR